VRVVYREYCLTSTDLTAKMVHRYCKRSRVVA
jgi:hypothetical protein